MSFIDSKAAFEQRCNELSAPAGLYDLLIAQQVDTFSSLAYAIATPNRSPTDMEFDTFANQVFGSPTLGQMSLLRRIHFESCTFILQHLKSQVAGDTQDGIRNLPFAEKQARFEAARTKLSGFIIQGETEPSFALIDKCQAMYDSGAVTWIPPSACTKRDLEIQAAPKDSAQVVRIEAQTLKVDTESQKIGDADHGSEIKLQWCLQRKGIALEMCNLISWNLSQEWIANLFNVYSTDPPPGFGRISLQQLIRADKELWTLMARTATTIKPDGAGKRPLDEVMSRVTMHLLALPHRAASSTQNHSEPSDNKRHSQSSNSNAAKQAPKKKMRPGRNQRTKPTPPAELKDCYQTTSDGKPICWAYNLAQGCSLGTSGNPPSCSKGCHVCAFCRKIGHSFQVHAPTDHDEVWRATHSTTSSFEDKLVIEIFAGTGNLSAAIRRIGMRSVAIDKSGARTKGPLTVLDLTDESNVKLLKEYIYQERYNIELVHVAPPCGTCSAARKIVRQDLLDQGFELPRPLRDEEHPMGLPDLAGLDLHKVRLANQLYEATYDLIKFCLSLGIRTSLENPTNSLFWKTSPIVKLLEEHYGHHNVFHNCMMGGKRDKSTTWWRNDDFFSSFNILCTRDHQHAKWQPTILRGSKLHFPTSEEAEYPCERVAMLIKQSLADRNIYPVETMEEQLAHRTPEDFLEHALKVRHPRFLPYPATGAAHDLLDKNIYCPAGKLVTLRNEFFKVWVTKAGQLADDEKRLHDSMEPHVRKVLHGKRLLVLRDILQELQFPDEKLFEDLIVGFRLTGWMRDSGCFLSIPRPPTLTLDGVKRLNKGLLSATLKRVEQQAVDKLSMAAWDETLKELDRSWIWEDSSTTLVGKVIAHRFGLEQKDKVRVIDNFKQCGLNDTCGLPEKYVLHGVDYIAATLIHGMKLHGAGFPFELLGKTFDLSSAYKQYPLHSHDRDLVRIALKDTETDACRVFGLNALPFGATGSVAGFLRISSAIFFVLTQGLHIWSSAFFDDFPTLSVADASAMTDKHVAMLFDLLGVDFAREGKKCAQFGSQMKALGLVFDLEQFSSGKVYIRHTAERKTELLDRLNDILERNELSPKDAESLRGRLHWYESYLFGRTANLAIHQLGKRISAPSWTTSLGSELESVLRLLRDRVVSGPPLILRADMDTPLLIFTDGACEGDELKTGSVGGVLYCGSNAPLRYFSGKVPALLMQDFLQESKNPIYLIEMLACYIAFKLWGSSNLGCYVVLYLDNEASRGAFIKGYSTTRRGNIIVQLVVSCEDSSQWKAW
ncbi:unnamed protein product [Effrenium voratum]|uniref:Uncharacterized protein n=1 Tax=Effrenium voratum TaxID=2562239 RepID=A0AA36N1B3_9DINO|nr:unnamed protein product [Effrenium voratum]